MFAVTADSLTPRPDLESSVQQSATPWAMAAAADRLLVLRPDEDAPLAEYRADQDGRLSLQPVSAAVTRLWPALRGGCDANVILVVDDVTPMV